ncbi:MAG TPA: glycosyltransferase family 39 protein [Rubricoccaceae bacterium]|nr:glycosyltransferase family 39 protein [Rubricoccaceae bacterium]
MERTPTAADRVTAWAARVPWWRLLRTATWGVAVLQVGIVGYAVCRRVGYPYELEWMEGAVAEHVRRLLAGAPLYVAPSLEFVPYLYPPLYYAAGAPLAAVMGAGFLPLRLLSVAATLACAALVYHLAARPDTTGGKPDREAGFVAAALFVGAYFAGGAWFDVARVDMLFLALFLGGVAAARRRTGGAYALAGLLLGLALLTKQVGLLAGLPLLAYAFLVDGRRALPFAGAAALVGGGGIVALHLASGGWSTFYILAMPGAHPVVPSNHSAFLLTSLFEPFPIAACLAGVAVVAGLRRGDALWVALALGAGAAVLASRLHVGGHMNVLIPLYAVGGALAGRGLTVLRSTAAGMGARRPAALALLYGALVLQFLGLVEHPMTRVPWAADRASAQRLEAHLATLPRPAYITTPGYLAVRAGHPRQADLLAVWDVLRSDTEVGRRFRAELEATFAARRYARIVLPDMIFTEGFEPEPHYRRVGDLGVTLYGASGTFKRFTGHPAYLRYVYAPATTGAPAPSPSAAP